MSVRNRLTTRLTALAAGTLVAGALLGSAPTSEAPASTSTTAAAPAPAQAAGFVPGSVDDAQNAMLRDRLERALAAQGQDLQQGDAAAEAAVTTVYYDASQAPSFAGEIAQSASIWNSSVSNVRLVEGSPATLDYYEGNDSRGSYAYSDGHGNGYVFLDHAQNEQYDALRVTTHETGHVLGLPDTYSGPCSQLMSGGGPGTSCTNAYPDATERSQVEALWANGFVQSELGLAAFGR